MLFLAFVKHNYAIYGIFLLEKLPQIAYNNDIKEAKDMALNINKIKNVMNEKGLGNKDLSAKSGVPLRTINNILGGITSNPTIDNMIAIAHALDCIVDDFIYDPAAPEIHTIAAHHDGEEWTDEELSEIEEFKKFVLSKRGGK